MGRLSSNPQHIVKVPNTSSLESLDDDAAPTVDCSSSITLPLQMNDFHLVEAYMKYCIATNIIDLNS